MTCANRALKLLSQLGRLVLDGRAPAQQRLHVAADAAVVLVADGRRGRTAATTALFLTARAGGVGAADALAIIGAAFRRGGPA